MNRSAFLAALGTVALASALIGVQSAHGETAQSESANTPRMSGGTTKRERLDAPLTSANSFLMDFGGGVVLRIPKMLYPSLDLTQVAQPVKTDGIHMTFWYPDMTLTDMSSPEIPRKGEEGYQPPRDRFWVQIVWMVYVPRDWDTFVPGSKQPPAYGPVPRPPRIELNRYCYGFVDGRCSSQMRRVASGLAGIDALHNEEWIRLHPEAATHHLEEGGVYVARKTMPYELFMDCTSFDSLGCKANVYSKRHQLQYQMYFSPRPVVHTDELIRRIERLLDGWAGGR